MSTINQPGTSATVTADAVKQNTDQSILQRSFSALPAAINVPIYLQLLQRGDRDGVKMTRDGGVWTLRNDRTDERYSLPRKPNLGQIGKVSEGYAATMTDKYVPSDLVDLDESSTVVDVGAFVGAFSRGVASMVDRVIAVEPSPETVTCLRGNLAGRENVELHEGAVGEYDGSTEIHLGDDPSDNGRFDIDGRSLDRTVTVQISRLDTLAERYGLDGIDLLKVDAEGAEPEVLEAIDSTDVDQVVVDVTPERFGESTASEVDQRLTDAGYETTLHGNVLVGVDR